MIKEALSVVDTLKLALEALETLTEGHSLGGKKLGDKAITAIKEAVAQPEQEQRCYCGNIYNLGVIHRDDGPCHYPEHTSEYKRGYADAMNWKVQNHLEHLQPKVRTGDCLLTGVCASEGHKIQPKEPEQRSVSEHLEPVAFPDAPQTIYLQVGDECPDDAKWKELIDVCWCDEQVFDNDIVYVRADTTPPQRDSSATPRTWVGLTDEEIRKLCVTTYGGYEFCRLVEAKLREKNQ